MRGPGHNRSERTTGFHGRKGGCLPPWYTRDATPSGSAAPRAPPTRSVSRGDGHQADLPTQEEVPAQDAWVSHTHVESRRPPGPEGAAPQGPQALDAGSDAMNRRHRLSGRRRIAAVRESGSEARSGAVRVRAVSGEADAARVAFAVPGAGGAVRRNRARRRLRAAIAPLLLDCPRLDLVVSLPGHASEMPFTDLQAALASALGSVQTRIRT
jgi:ribonuclease P protein component